MAYPLKVAALSAYTKLLNSVVHNNIHGWIALSTTCSWHTILTNHIISFYLETYIGMNTILSQQINRNYIS